MIRNRGCEHLRAVAFGELLNCWMFGTLLRFSFMHRSLDCTNFCAVFPEFAEVRSQVLADYYDKKNDLYS